MFDYTGMFLCMQVGSWTSFAVLRLMGYPATMLRLIGINIVANLAFLGIWYGIRHLVRRARQPTSAGSA